MSVISTFKAIVTQKLHGDDRTAPDPNDISLEHGDVYVEKLVDVSRAAKMIVEYAGRRTWSDRWYSGRLTLNVYAMLDYGEWFELTKATALNCPPSLVLVQPTYAALRPSQLQMFIFEMRSPSSKGTRLEKRTKINLDV